MAHPLTALTVNVEGVGQIDADSLTIEAHGTVYTVYATLDGHLRLHAKNGERLAMRTEGPIASNAIDVKAHRSAS